MSRSKYTDSVVLTRKHSGRRKNKVQAFVIHHMAAVWTGKQCAQYFASNNGRQASCNYCIGYNGDVALNVEEHNRAWTSSSSWADNRAITFELANSRRGEPWVVSDTTINKLILMLVELHQKYGLSQCTYTGDTKGTLWRHDWFAQTNCPGTYLGGKLSYIAQEVNKRLGASGGAIKVKDESARFTTNTAIKVRNKPSTQAKHVKTADKGTAIDYHAVYEGNGYRWLAYKEGGQTLYIPYRSLAKPKEVWGEFGKTPVEWDDFKDLKEGDAATVGTWAAAYHGGQSISPWVKGSTYTVHNRQHLGLHRTDKNPTLSDDAYTLKDSQGTIIGTVLGQDIVECQPKGRKEKEIKAMIEKTNAVKKGEAKEVKVEDKKDDVKLKEGQFILDGKLYQIEEVE